MKGYRTLALNGGAAVAAVASIAAGVDWTHFMRPEYAAPHTGGV